MSSRVSRAARRDRALARVTKPIPPELKAADPLVHSQGTLSKRIGWVSAVVVLAVVVHVAVLLSLAVAATVMKTAAPEKIADEPIEVAIVQPPPPPPPPPETTPEVEDKPEPEAPKPKPKPKLQPKADPPPPDPTNLPEKEPPPPDKPPPRRIVGLSMESTVGGGGGPSFAVGNTRMGTTEKTAENPTEAKPLPKTLEPPPPTKTNRRAARIPVANEKVIPPKPRSKVIPEYPEMYRAQNLEARVIIQVTVGIDGRTKNARVITKSPYEKFNEAALEAAKLMTFDPATKGGKPIELTIPIPFTFKIVD